MQGCCRCAHFCQSLQTKNLYIGMNELIFETDFVQLHFDATVPCVTATLLRFMNHEEYKLHLNKGLDIMKDKIKSTGRMMWLPDTRLSPVFADEDTAWAIEDWTPRALVAGIYHVAFVIPQSEWAQVGVEDYGEGSKGDGEKQGMTVAFFTSQEEAKDWFRNLNKYTVAK